MLKSTEFLCSELRQQVLPDEKIIIIVSEQGFWNRNKIICESDAFDNSRKIHIIHQGKQQERKKKLSQTNILHDKSV